MKRLLLLSTLLVVLFGCKKPVEDWRTPYTGMFDFTCYWSQMVSTSNVWEERWQDTTYCSSVVELFDPNRLKIKFGERAFMNGNDTVFTMTVTPILENDGTLTFPREEYPSGGHNMFEGRFLSLDTIKIDFTYSLGIGGYDKYQVVGIRKQ